MYSQEEVDAMLEEGLKLKHFQHTNVLNLIGVCVEAGPAPYIVMPFMSNGSLLSYLRREKPALVLMESEDEEMVSIIYSHLSLEFQPLHENGRVWYHRYTKLVSLVQNSDITTINLLRGRFIMLMRNSAKNLAKFG